MAEKKYKEDYTERQGEYPTLVAQNIFAADIV